jgi:hypothetical protein
MQSLRWWPVFSCGRSEVRKHDPLFASSPCLLTVFRPAPDWTADKHPHLSPMLGGGGGATAVELSVYVALKIHKETKCLYCRQHNHQNTTNTMVFSSHLLLCIHLSQILPKGAQISNLLPSNEVHITGADKVHRQLRSLGAENANE